MLWISCNPSVAQRRRETDRCPVEFPTAHSLFESCEKLFWSHSRSGRKLALFERRHQQFYMCAADIDDQNFSFHERRPIPEIFGSEATGRAGASGEDAERRSAVLVLLPCCRASIPRFRGRETGTAIAAQISNRALGSSQFVAPTEHHCIATRIGLRLRSASTSALARNHLWCKREL